MLDLRPAASAALISIAALLLHALLALMLPGRLAAHSWYPPICCSERDCMKVDRIEYVTGGMVMTAGAMKVFVPHSMQKQASQDTDAHICVGRSPTGTWSARCVFLPGTARAPSLRQLAAR